MAIGSISWIWSQRLADLTSRFGERRLIPTNSRVSPDMAKFVEIGSISSYFESLDDPRHTRNRKHLLVDIAVIAVCAIICGCDGPAAIHRWAVHRQSWLARHLALPNGIPSRDCIRRVLMVLQPEAFQRCFQAWISQTIAADADDPDRLVAIDGKACRRSHDRANDLGALHIVSAWAIRRGGARTLGDRVDALGAGRGLRRG